MFPASNFPQMAAIMFDLTEVTFWFSTRKNTSGKFRQRLRKRPRSGSGITEGKNAGIRAKQCEISEECFPWQLVGMIQGAMRSQGAAFHPQSCAGTNTQHAENILVLVLKSHHIGAYLEGTWRVWQARSCSEIRLSKILVIIIILKRAGTLSASAFFFCFLLLRLLPGAACLKREEGRNFRN